MVATQEFNRFVNDPLTLAPANVKAGLKFMSVISTGNNPAVDDSPLAYVVPDAIEDNRLVLVIKTPLAYPLINRVRIERMKVKVSQVAGITGVAIALSLRMRPNVTAQLRATDHVPRGNAVGFGFAVKSNMTGIECVVSIVFHVIKTPVGLATCRNNRPTGSNP